MKYNIEYLSSNDLFVVKTSGIMNAGDFLAMAADILEHSYWATNKNVIFDHEHLDFTGVPFDDIQKIRAFHNKNENKIGNGKSAIVVRTGFFDAWQELWSQGEKIQTANNVRVFEQYADAINWILDT